jgi:hypothetical protein
MAIEKANVSGKLMVFHLIVYCLQRLSLTLDCSFRRNVLDDNGPGRATNWTFLRRALCTRYRSSYSPGFSSFGTDGCPGG